MGNLKSIIRVFSFCLLTSISHAETTLERANVYNVPDSVAFDIGSYGHSDFVFNWQNQGAVITQGIYDPTLILSIGSTYTFERSSGGHPFVILNLGNDAAFTGTDGSFYRTASAPSSLSILFTASPAPGNIVSWTPTIVGDYFYTCAVGSHGDMSGLLTVVAAVPEPSTLSFAAILLLLVLFYRRFFPKKELG
jgi:hypothetical protein